MITYYILFQLTGTRNILWPIREEILLQLSRKLLWLQPYCSPPEVH